MSELGTRIMAAGLVDEGIEVEAMEKEVSSLREKLSSSKPVCPICKQVMEPTNYQGYYDTFSYWACRCEHFPGVGPVNGMYA